jgi:hypothetical protein
VNDLHVNCELAALITDDHDTNRASTTLKSLAEAGPEVGLVNHRKGLLDVALEKVSKSRSESKRADLSITYRLSHSDNGSICHIQNSVLFEHGSKHGLYYNAWARITNEAAFLMQLLRKEVNS